jgi:OOP family OmpA-OmpF porin
MLEKLALSLVIGASAASVFAQTTTDIQAKTPNSAYAQDARGVIVRDAYGLCWHTANWTPADAVTGCDGELAPPIAKPTAPALAPITGPMTAMPEAELKRCDFVATLESDQTFLFNQATLSTAAKTRIANEILPKLTSCAKIDRIMVTGHTDRLGSEQYNQKLSEKRASSVATYLKSKGVSAHIETIGAGKSQPIKVCDGRLPHKKLVACLSPNRRVSIDLKGTEK